ncbi:MAG: hypothetical protein GC181_01785 [Bacteroidetes bacterium]|nr:hypothetical protein [Bacteroidota bacterium]
MQKVITLFCFWLYLYSNVNAQLEVKISNGNISACSGDSILLDSKIIQGTPVSYVWSCSSTGFKDSTAPKTKAAFTSTGWLILTCKDATSTSIDSVMVTVSSSLNLIMPSDKRICCDDDPLDLTLFENKDQTGGNWFCKISPTLISNDTLYPKIECGAYDRTFFITYSYTGSSAQCSDMDSFKVTLGALPSVILQDSSFCQGRGVVNLKNDHIIITPSNPNLGRQTWSCVDCGSYNSNKIIEDLGSGLPGAPQNYVINIDDSSMPLGSKSRDSVTIELLYANSFGCENRDTATLTIYKSPKINFQGFDRLCWDEGIVDLKKLSNVTPTNGYWFAVDTLTSIYRPASDLNPVLMNGPNKGDTLNTLKLPQPVYPNPHKYYMRYYHDASGCPVFRDTVLIINPLPKPVITKKDFMAFSTKEPFVLCENHYALPLDAGFKGGIWKSNYPSSIKKDSFYATLSPKEKPIHIYYEYKDVHGCFGSDSISVSIEYLPTIQVIPHDLKIFSDTPTVVKVYANHTHASGITWTSLTGGSINETKADTVLYTISNTDDSCRKFLLYVQTRSGYACPFTDDLFTAELCPEALSVENLTPTLTIKVYPNPSNGSFTISNADQFETEFFTADGKLLQVNNTENGFETDYKGLIWIRCVDLQTGLMGITRLVLR